MENLSMKDLRDLLLRALGGIENPDDLSSDDVQDLVEDLQNMADHVADLMNAET